MSKKKLYSFRAAPELLSALREEADQQGTTVSDVIHTILSEALNLPKDSEQNQSEALRSDATRTLIEEIKEEVSAQIRQEITAQIKKELKEIT